MRASTVGFIVFAWLSVGCDGTPLFYDPNFGWHSEREASIFQREASAFYDVEEGNRMVVVVVADQLGMDPSQDVVVLEFDAEDRLERGIVISLTALETGKPRLYQYAVLDAKDAKLTSAWRSKLSYAGVVVRRSMPDSEDSWAHESSLRFEVTATHNPRKVNEIRRSLDYSLSSREGIIWKLLDSAGESR